MCWPGRWVLAEPWYPTVGLPPSQVLAFEGPTLQADACWGLPHHRLLYPVLSSRTMRTGEANGVRCEV